MEFFVIVRIGKRFPGHPRKDAEIPGGVCETECAGGKRENHGFAAAGERPGGAD